MATVRTRYDFQYFIIFSNMKSISLQKNAYTSAENPKYK
jgi:hypothetical protein